MPSDIQHIDHAQHNIGFLESFYSSYEFNDWSVTVSFYIAVHIIEAVIYIVKNIKIHDKSYEIRHSEQLVRSENIESIRELNYHQARMIIVQENFTDIGKWFKLLYNYSRTARYTYYSFENYKVDILIKPGLMKIIEWYNSKKYPTEIQIAI